MKGKIRVSIVATALDGHKTQNNTVLNMTSRIQNRNHGYSEGLFSQNSNLENNTLNSIDGATALKLDQKFEVNEQEDQSLINNLEQSAPDSIDETNKEEATIDNIPSGLSIENASYIENSNDNSALANEENIDLNTELSHENEEEHTPRLFESDSEAERELEQPEDSQDETLFDQDANEEEDFEIPAFLRKQKF